MLPSPLCSAAAGDVAFLTSLGSVAGFALAKILLKSTAGFGVAFAGVGAGVLLGETLFTVMMVTPLETYLVLDLGWFSIVMKHACLIIVN